MEQKTRDERIAELLAQSGAEAVSAIKGPSLSDIAPIESKVEEQVQDVEEEETPSGGKKVRIPLSRLKTLTTKVEELESKLQESQTYAERVAALEAQIANKGEEDLPDWWKEAYGDDENARKGYKHQQRIMREELQRSLQEQEAQRLAEEAARNERIEQIESSFDEQMDSLEESIGRELTATQKAELLDIVGEYSPQENGQYIAYLPVEKAYDIWQKGQGLGQGKQEMARIAGIQSSGSGQNASPSERPQWGDWRKRF